MNIGLFLNRDIYANVALNYLSDGLREHRLFIFFSDSVGKAPPHEALDVLRLIEQDIPNDYLYPSIHAPGELLSFAEVGRRHDCPLETVSAPNGPEALERLGSLELDVVVSIRYGRIFRERFLRVPRLGVLNLHSGILPDYRGVMATFHALAAGESEIGCTLHVIDDASIDTGAVVGTWRRPVDRTGSYFGHVLSLYQPGAHLVVDAVARLVRGERLETRPQARGQGAYFTFPSADDIARFESAGYRLFHAAEYRELLKRYRST